jgi:hypothetical protein
MRVILTGAVALALVLLAVPVLSQDQGVTPDQSVSKTDSKVVDGTTAGGLPLPASDVRGAVGQGKAAVKAAKEGRWWYCSALVLTVLMFLLKLIGTKVGFWPKLGRWRYVIVPVLSLAAAMLAAFQGGVSIDTALGVFTSAYAMSSLQELFEHGILGKPRASSSST